MKKEFIERYAKKEKITLKEAEIEINIFIETLKNAILKYGEVKFRNYGNFEIIKKQPRFISNPWTFEKMYIYPKPTIKFSCSPALKKKL